MPQTKEEIKEYQRLYYEKNKEKREKQKKEWYEKNKEKQSVYYRNYKHSKKGKKTVTIGQWKTQGILCFDWDLLYDIFLSTDKCENCNVELTTSRIATKTRKCLDHDHTINDKFNVRGVLCNSCNLKNILN